MVSVICIEFRGFTFTYINDKVITRRIYIYIYIDLYGLFNIIQTCMYITTCSDCCLALGMGSASVRVYNNMGGFVSFTMAAVRMRQELSSCLGVFERTVVIDIYIANVDSVS